MTKKQIHSALLVLLITVSFNFSIAQVPDTLKGALPFTSGHYLPGIWDIRDFTTPPPGIAFLDYNIYLSARKFMDQEGNQVTHITGPFGTTELNIDLNGYINAPNIFYASSFKILGGATYMAGISVPYLTVNTDIAYDRIAQILRDTIMQSGTVTGDASGFGDMNVFPFGLSWASPQFNLTALYSFFAPTGRYELGGSDNVGLGYWTNMFQLFGYAYPMKINGKPSQAMAIMAATTYEINSKIDGVDVTPGNRFTIEYGVSQYLSERFEIGFMGGNNFQITNDKGEDVWWNPSILDQAGYIGFQVGGWPWKNRLYTAVKYNIDYGNRQRLRDWYA